ncbi:MAG TPA: protein kinase [Sandaracinaceae bacterium LLY-WYZ-13_1]|nr:protein kinase [Sandaracinaceae bacterium LLY-WYZ-13_1]
MRTDREYLDGLARLHRTADADERRALWRQSMATLAAEAADHRPVPLEGLDPQEVLASTRTAIGMGLVDDLDFLTPAHSAAALYELASVLPMGEERRELGRRVARRLHTGDAGTFVALATQLAMGSRRALSGAAVRARVALALDLPIGSGTRADALALALISRHDLAQEWLIGPATGSLPSRRLAARLLERAAREAARRCAQGDDSVLAVFSRDAVHAAWERLLGDRESLVWRHVATARGLLSEHAVHLADEIRTHLDEGLTATEWRRAAASLAASVAVAPGKALARAMAFLDGPIPAKDPGVASAMLLGLPRAAEVEPEAAEELTTALVREGGVDAAQALLSLRHERVGGEFGAWACQMARAKLRERALADADDDGLAALAEALDQDLRPQEERDAPPTLRMHLEEALAAFAEQDARTAYAKAHSVLAEVEMTLVRLEASPQHTAAGRRQAYLALRELDGALLETSTLADLLTLGARGDDGSATAPLNAYFARITDWLLRHEQAPVAEGDPVTHRTLRISRMRTLLHAIDADGPWGDGLGEDLRARRLRTVQRLLGRVRDDAESPLTRVVTASAARACDALLREEVGELSDVFLAVVNHVETVEGLTTMAEASMVPEMENVFHAYATLVSRTARDARTSGTRARASLDALRTLIRSFPAATSPRVDALHGALHAFGTAVERVMAARSLAELSGETDGGSRVAELERATRLLGRLVVGARRRLGEHPEDTTGVAGPALRVVDIAVERAYRGDQKALTEALGSALGALHEDLPSHLAEVAANALIRALKLPREPKPGTPPRDSFLPAPPKESPLPPWLPPSRTLGGFYVLRALGSGAVGSVFVARRTEEKKNEDAPSFALKVPEYSGAAARTLSEDEFLRLFREEAGALLAIPEHENLARLVTFDAGARPKPILVMELVEGPTLERTVETGALDVQQTFALLDGIAAGLGAMHAVGVGHLDVKPSNVILRDPDPLMGQPGIPVLVDFGLAGRHVRPGCATASYGAPEVWGLLPKGHQPDPMAVDVYAFGCLAFEVLTGRELIHGPSEVSIITAHLSHDGDHEGLRWLGQDPGLAAVAGVLSGAVRQDPRQRTPIDELRRQLAEVAGALADRRWPLEVHAAA